MKDLIQIMAVFAVILTIIPTIVFLRPNESASKPAFSEKEPYISPKAARPKTSPLKNI